MQPTKPTILCTGPVDLSMLHPSDRESVVIDMANFTSISTTIPVATQQEIKKLASEKATVVFTSGNALRSISGLLAGYKLDWTIFCLGQSTYELAKNIFGEKVIRQTASSAAELAHAIINEKNITRVSFFCGNLRRDDLPRLLRAENIEVKEITVYQTMLTPRKIEKKYDAILFFSPGAAESFFSNNRLPLQTVVFVIGSTTAGTVSRYTNNLVVTAAEPDKLELINKAIKSLVSPLA